MKKGTLALNFLIVGIFLFGVPLGLMYKNDTTRIKQLNILQKKISYSEKDKDRQIVMDQMKEKMNVLFGQSKVLTEGYILKKYSKIIYDRTIRNTSYSKRASRSAIKKKFMSYAKKMNADVVLLFRNGRVLGENKKVLSSSRFKGNTKFLQTIASKKIISDIDFSGGTASYFIPVLDTKDRLVSVVYVKEDISAVTEKMRNETQSKRGYNFIVDATGNVLLSTDKTKENTENIQENNDLKGIITNVVDDENIKEVDYTNARGFLAYRKNKDMGYVFCVFSPYTDYESLKSDAKTKYDLFINDTSFILPIYAILGGVLLIGTLLIVGISGEPYKPLKKITRALTHIDEESFESLLPKIKRGDYKKIINSLIILKGRVSASEEKTEKLSQMSKELEEELSKEASRADMELSELRDTVKIAETNKATAEDEVMKVKNKIKLENEAALKKIEQEKAELEVKIKTMEKDKVKLVEEVKKSQESKIPVEKENMRMESVLMMNTELKGVLSVIKTYISSVLGGEGKITDAQQQFLGVVINKSARLERLINDLTELARLEKGEVRLNKGPVDINTVIQDIVFGIQPQADVKKVELKVKFAPTIPTGLGDSSKLSNIVTQILTQAIKVSPRGGQVIAETQEDDKSVMLRIADFGMSMPKAKADALFMNFHGPESLAGPEFINTGLRFPIIKAVISSMGGEVFIESEIGKGKTFVFKLLKDTRTAGVTDEFSPAKKEARETIIRPPAEPKNADLPEPPKATMPTMSEKLPIEPQVKPPVEPPKATMSEKLPMEPQVKPPVEPSKPIFAEEKPASPSFGDAPKIMDSLASISEKPSDSAEMPPPISGGSFKIQTNAAAGVSQGDSVPGAKPGMDTDTPKVSELLTNNAAGTDKKPDMPGNDLKVSDDLLADKPAPPKAPLPDELPPLPDLEDDKGTDII